MRIIEADASSLISEGRKSRAGSQRYYAPNKKYTEGTKTAFFLLNLLWKNKWFT